MGTTGDFIGGAAAQPFAMRWNGVALGDPTLRLYARTAMLERCPVYT